jgi:hypothetical protein
MPHKPHWFRDFATIERHLNALAEPFLDRRAIEQIFHVSQTEAGRLMRRMGAIKAGAAHIVSRRTVILWIRKIARTDDFEYEARRVERVGAHLAEAGRALAARSIAVPPARSEAFADLPANIELSAGRLVVTFAGAAELLQALNEIVQAAARDFPRFQSACED